MRAGGRQTQGDGACLDCLRRSWLLSELSAPLDYRCRNRDRFLGLLKLSDEELVQAIGGRRREELMRARAQFQARNVRRAREVDAVCRHDPRYPQALQDPGAPCMLNVVGGVERLGLLTKAATVAIVGSSRATDYGMEMAKSLARGLAASGVTVTSGLSDGIAAGALAGALEVDGGTITVLAGGLDVACPVSRRSLYERARQAGCGLAEVPCGCRPRRWTQAGTERILAGLAELTVVVEAREGSRELAGARTAQALGRTVAAVPGRVTSRASSGTHVLLMDGAHLVRGPADALELLHGGGVQTPYGGADARTGLEPRLRDTLEQVGSGRDTPDKLASAGDDAGATLLALSELELLGLLTRGDGGRYVPRHGAT
jgi:DNA processing protein